MATEHEITSPPLPLLLPMNVPTKLLFGPGPSTASPRVLAAGSLPLLGHLHSEFTAIMDECKLGIQYLFQTANKYTFAVSASGHGAMECITTNLVEKGTVVLIVKIGIWGERFADMCNRLNAEVVLLESPKSITLAEVREALVRYKPSLLFVTHGESSMGLLQGLEGFGEECHKNGCLFVVDSVATAGAVPLFMDKWNIDALYTGSQKALSATPGVSPISFSNRAVQHFKNRSTQSTSFYFDLSHLANYWGIEGPRKYHHTGLISSVYSLREGLSVLAEETLPVSWARHAQCTKLLYKGLEEMGLKMFLSDDSERLPTVTTVSIPNGINGVEVCQQMMKKYRIEVAGGLGPTAGKVWRIGVMGHNAKPENIELVLKCFKDVYTGIKQTSCKI